MKPLPTYLLVALLGIAIGFLLCAKTCNAPSGSAQTTIDSLTRKIAEDSNAFRRKRDSTLNNLMAWQNWADSLQHGWDSSKTLVKTKGAQVLSLNGRLKEALAAKDTPAVYVKCDSLSRQLDSAAQLIWEAGRTVDSLLFVNDDIKSTQTKLIADYDNQLTKERQSYNSIMQAYAAQHVYDSLQLKRVKKQRVGWAIVGGAGGMILRSFLK